MITIPRMILRRSNLVDMSLRIDPQVSMYRFSGASTLNNAWSANVPMFEAISGLHYRSLTLKQKNLGYVEDIKRGYTRVTFNPNDFAANPLLPKGDSTLYLRVEEYNKTLGAYNPPGAIVVIPPEDVWMRDHSTFALYGTAPVSATAAVGLNPTADVMVINMSLYSTSFYLRNLDSAVDLWYSYSEGSPMTILPHGTETSIQDSSSDLLFICSGDAMKASTVDFSITYSCRHS